MVVRVDPIWKVKVNEGIIKVQARQCPPGLLEARNLGDLRTQAAQVCGETPAEDRIIFKQQDFAA